MTNSWTTPGFVLRRWIPAACGIFLAGFALSVAAKCTGRSATLEDAIMSDLLSPSDNPRGYLIAAMATMLCGLLLLPAATLFQHGWNQPRRRWAVLGAWLYRLGLIATMAVGMTTPFQQPYVPVHLWLAFAAFMSLAAGLAVSLGVAACSATSARARFALGSLGALQIGTVIFLACLLVTPDYFQDRRWFMAVCEWGLSALIAAGTVAVAATLARLR
ncbi:MAG: hypothetical protein ABSC03_07315 [Verrucomicrobiota bacterium]